MTLDHSWRTLIAVCAVAALAALAFTGIAMPAPSCTFCGKNLINNPGAEAGKGLNAANETGAVPGWTNTAGQFSAGLWTGFGIGWFSAASKGPADRGRNYFFGGTTPAATGAKATIGTQTIKAPAGAAGHKATPERLARQLRLRHGTGTGAVHGRGGEGARDGPDRP